MNRQYDEPIGAGYLGNALREPPKQAATFSVNRAENGWMISCYDGYAAKYYIAKTREEVGEIVARLTAEQEQPID